MSVLGTDFEGPHPYDTFPYNGVDFETTERVEVNNHEEIWDIISAWDAPNERKYGMAIGKIASPKNLFDAESVSIIQKYIYCKDMYTPAYPGTYGEYPAWWIQACNIIQHNIVLAQEHQQKINKEK